MPEANAPTRHKIGNQRAKGALLGAAFLMATSAIGPGFLTQTTVFTAQLGASFGFVILISFLLDLGAQINIWRIITSSGMRAPTLANRMFMGLGHFLTLLIAIGGIAFNIGNIGGAGLGLNVLTGMPIWAGAVLSCVIAVVLFIRPEAGAIVDWFAKILGVLMIALTAWIVIAAKPPLGEAFYHSFLPAQIDGNAILTIVGGTVGGYISFAGAHRLLDAGVRGAENVPEATRSAFSGIAIATAMRILLFLAAWGIVAQGLAFDLANPPASMFRLASGELGFRFFGLVMWAAAITSVVGATFTSISFIQDSLPSMLRYKKALIGGFTALSLAVFLYIGKPVNLLIFVGKLNGMILPIALATMLLIARKPENLGGYKLPVYWQVAGWVVVAAMASMIF